MKITVTITPTIAERLANSIPTHPRMGETHAEAAATQRAETRALTELSAPRGTRCAGTNAPKNMMARMAADEARAWAHSDLAGVLWEKGIRASRAIAWANQAAWSTHSHVTIEPLTSTGGVTGWAIMDPQKNILAETSEPANRGAMHRILADAGFVPDLPSSTRWIAKK